MTSRSQMWLLALLVGGCSTGVDQHHRLEAREDVAYWAAVSTHSDRGGVKSASGLFAVDDPIRFNAARDGAALIIVGYLDDGLFEFSATAEAQPLRESSGCEPDLGLPVWTHTIEGEPPDQLPRLTSDAVRASCRPLLEPDRTGFVAMCGEEFCGQAWRQDGCSIHVGLDACGFSDVDALRIAMRPDGTCLQDADTPCQLGASDTSLPAPQCTLADNPCELQLLYPETQDAEIERIDVVTETREDLVLPESRHPDALAAGYLNGLVVGERRVFTAAYAQPASRTSPGARLVAIERDTLRVVIDRPLEQGLWPSVSDPHGEGFIALGFAPEGEVTVERWDANGQKVASAKVTPMLRSQEAIEWHGLAYVAAIDRFVLAAHGTVDQAPPVSYLYQFDGTTLAPAPSCPPRSEHAYASIRAHGSHVYLADDKLDGYVRVDPADCAVVHEVPISGGAATPAALIPTAGEVIVALAGNQRADALHVFDMLADRARARAAYFEARGFTTALALRGSELWAGVTVSSRGAAADAQSQLTRFDLSEDRFAPASVPLGYGPSTGMQFDEAGDLWTIQPWTGEVLRVRVP